jgi:hypothetical protein
MVSEVMTLHVDDVLPQMCSELFSLHRPLPSIDPRVKDPVGWQ